MKVIFVSNYFNHHQKPLCDAFYGCLGDSFRFVETEPMSSWRRELGYGMDSIPSYVLTAYADKKRWNEAAKLIDEADAVIAGSAPESLLQNRIRSGKLTFRYSERPVRETGYKKLLKYIPRLIKWHYRNPVWRPIFMLCASAYTASDYAKFGLFRGKSYKWGYFPETKCYEDLAGLMNVKDSASILWVGRMIHWKHPDDALEVVRRLRQEGCQLSMTMIGIGPMEQVLRSRIDEYGMQDCVSLPGSMKPEQVRTYMEKAGIFLFTSDHQEGWGAVLNESMNSGCAVVGSDAIGSVPYLIRDGENGLMYPSGNVDALYEKVRFLLDHPKEQTRLGTAAYRTISGEWNAEQAAERFLHLTRQILSGDKKAAPYADGPCSKA